MVASDTAPVREFVADGATGRLTPFFDPLQLAGRVLETLEDRDRTAGLRAAARAWAETHLRMADHVAAYSALVARLVGA